MRDLLDCGVESGDRRISQLTRRVYDAYDLRMITVDPDWREPTMTSGAHILIEVTHRVPVPRGISVVWGGMGDRPQADRASASPATRPAWWSSRSTRSSTVTNALMCPLTEHGRVVRAGRRRSSGWVPAVQSTVREGPSASRGILREGGDHRLRIATGARRRSSARRRQPARDCQCREVRWYLPDEIPRHPAQQGRLRVGSRDGASLPAAAPGVAPSIPINAV